MSKQLFIITILLVFNFVFSLTSPSIAYAEVPAPIVPAVDKFFLGDQGQRLMETYCTRRSQGELNLETWYGGKCNPSHIEETIGFGDIIIFHIIEKITGPQQPGVTDKILEKVGNMFKCMANPENNAADKILSCVAGFSEIPAVSNLASAGNQGALAALGNGISYLYANPPASSVDYVASVGENLVKHNIIKNAYAADPINATGYGFQALSSILPLWRIFRDIAYMVFVLIFVYYGFAIMFRMKMGAQTVASIEIALPKLIITLLLITFSYAIAGFLIDLFYLIVGFFFSLVILTKVASSPWYVHFLSGYSWGLIGPAIISLLHSVFLVGKIYAAILPIPSVVGQVLSVTILAPLSIVILLVIVFALLFTFIKLIWMLLKSYINMILQIIFAPIILLGNAFPGSNAFGNWVKSIFAELSVFASVMIMFTLAFYFLGGFLLGVFRLGDLDTSQPMWLPPPLFPEKVSALTGSWGSTDGKFAIVGLGIILMTPKLADEIRKTLKVSELGFGSAIGEAVNYGRFHSDRISKDTGSAANTLTGGRAGTINQYINRTVGWRPPRTPPSVLP